MIVQTPQELQTYRTAGQITTEIMSGLREAVKVGVFPAELDELAGELCQQHGVKPAFKGVRGTNSSYAYNSCISVNDEILHGIPSRDRALEKGDLVKLDFGVIYEGFYTDNCVTVGVGSVSNEDMKLLRVGRDAVQRAVSEAIAGNTTGDIGHQIEKITRRAGFQVLKQYIGHGIGRSLHEEPELPAWGKPGRGAHLRENMIICIEAQVLPHTDDVFIDTDNGWTVKSKSGEKGVMFEYLVRVGKQKPEVLTETRNWELIV